MTNVYNFKDQLTLGKLWEEAIIQHLLSKPETMSVRDLSEDREFQALGIDLLWTIENEQTWVLSATYLDVKTDLSLHKTWKIFIETLSSEIREGCMLSTKADMFIYYDPILWDLYYVPIFPLRQWYKRKWISKVHKTVQNEGYESEWILVGIDELKAILPNLIVEKWPTINIPESVDL